MEACIAGAIRKNSTTGVVTIDEQRCIGCWTCIMVCPFGAVASSGKREVAYKCDGCEESEEMACVEACPTGALLYCEPVELVGLKRRERAKREPMVTEARTGRLLRLGK